MALDEFTTPEEERNKRSSMFISMVVHIGLLLLALLPLLSYTDPPPGQEGILVNLGAPDVGQGFENAPPAPPQAVEESAPEPVEEPEIEEEEVPPPVVEEVPEPVEESQPKEVVQTEDPEQIALRKQQEEAERQRREEEAERQRREEEARQRAEAERRRREAELEAQRQAEAKRQAEADALKNELGGLLGEGSGKGDTNTQGNQGDPEGNPDASLLEGISSGAGKVGGGLSDRGLMVAPRPEDSSQNTGTVVIQICVDAGGNVIGTPRFTQRGSTTANAELVDIAIENAKKWKFSKGEIDRQCGTITYNFRVR